MNIEGRSVYKVITVSVHWLPPSVILILSGINELNSRKSRAH